MIIVDLGQIIYATLMVAADKKSPDELEDYFRHLALNKIRAARAKFKDKYGEMVIACDSGTYWRRDVFPYYKMNRDESRSDRVDWTQARKYLRAVQDDLRDFFPYRVVRAEKAEADDVIATLCHRFGDTNEPILLLSGDHDFVQLHTYINITQYNPIAKKFVTHHDPEMYRFEHFLSGDSGDGVPNVLSDDDHFIVPRDANGKRPRQKSLSAAKLLEWSKHKENFAEYLVSINDQKLARNYDRNKRVIDLFAVPEAISNEINSTYDSEAGKSRKKIFNYLISKRMKELMVHINDF